MTAGGPLIVAHRGASWDAPENTIAAFEEALRQRADMIEVDIQRCATGEIVVFHDDHLRRCTDVAERFPERVEWPLMDFSWTDLKTLSAQYSCSKYKQRAPIPRLTELLQWLVENPRMSANIELKTLPRLYPGLVSETLLQIERFQLGAQVLLSSFDHVALKQAKEQQPRIRTAVLTAERNVDLVRYAKDFVSADAINPGLHLLDSRAQGQSPGQLNGELIARAKDGGLETYVWTVNDEAMIKAVAGLGATGIITDCPAKARAAL